MRIIKIMCIAGILASFFTCQLPLQDVTTLSNGTVVTSEEKAKLDALKPEVDRILSEVLGDSVETNGAKKISSQEQADQIKERVTNLLKANFGDDYRKFITEKELVPVTKSKASNLSISSGKFSESITKNVSGTHGLQVGHDVLKFENFMVVYDYYFWVTASTYVSPWFSYNSVNQRINLLWSYYNLYSNGSIELVQQTTVPSPINYQTLSITELGVKYNFSASNASNCSGFGMLWPGKSTPTINTVSWIYDSSALTWDHGTYKNNNGNFGLYLWW